MSQILYIWYPVKKLNIWSAFLLLQTRRVELMPKSLIWSHLTTTLSPSSPLNHSDVHWQTSDGPVHVLAWAGGPCGCWRFSVLQVIMRYHCFLGDYGPSCLEIIDKILPCSSGLFPHRSHDHWNSTRWDLACSPSSSLVYVYNLVPDILGQLFGLGHGGEFRIWLIDWLIAYVDRLSFIQVTSRESL